MTVYLIRHAEKQPGSYFNETLRHKDQPISRRGRTDSKRLFSYLKDKSIGKLYVSSYIRTHQTAGHLAGKLKLTPLLDADLDEIDNGRWDALSEEEIQRQYPELLKVNQQQGSDFRFPEGETGEEAQQRIIRFLERARQIGEETVAISHDGLIRCLMCHLVGLPVWRRSLFVTDTCGITELEYSEPDGRWTLRRFNQQLF